MAEKNYYELLNITPEADEQEIEEAYKGAKAVYAEDSVALYSLYSQGERESILGMINDAYGTLSDPAKRKAYDAMLSTNLHKWKIPPRDDMKQEHGSDSFLGDIDEKKRLMYSVKPKKTPFIMEDMDQFAAEQYRVLYTRLEHISLENAYKTFAITSTVKGEGKTVTSLNLAYVMAHDFNKKVVVKTAVIKVENTALYLLPAKHNIKNSCELLGSQRMKATMNALKTEFDYIIIDSPPLLPLADMNVLSKIVDGLVLVVKAGKTPKDIVLKGIKSISDRNIVGIVLNHSDITLHKYYY